MPDHPRDCPPPDAFSLLHGLGLCCRVRCDGCSVSLPEGPDPGSGSLCRDALGWGLPRPLISASDHLPIADDGMAGLLACAP